MVLRDRRLDEPRDWTGYWILQAAADRGLPLTTEYPNSELVNKRSDAWAVLGAGLTQYYTWANDQDLNDAYIQYYTRNELWRMAKDRQQIIVEEAEQGDPDELIEFDTRAYATEVSPEAIDGVRM